MAYVEGSIDSITLQMYHVEHESVTSRKRLSETLQHLDNEATVQRWKIAVVQVALDSR